MLLLCFNVFAFDVRLPDEPDLTNSRPQELWLFFPLGYLLTIAIETPVLLIGLSKKLSFKQRFFAGIWLSACTYPIVVLVLPILFSSSTRTLYLAVAEIFAPLAECALFWLAFRGRFAADSRTQLRNFVVIIIANLLSFGVGEIFNSTRWFGLF